MKCKKLNFKVIEIILFMCSKNNTYLVLHKAFIDLNFFSFPVSRCDRTRSIRSVVLIPAVRSVLQKYPSL